MARTVTLGGNLITKNLIILSTFLFSLTAIAKDWKIATYNIRNFKSSRSTKGFKGFTSTDTRKLKKIIEETGADFIGVQEIVDYEGFREFVKQSLPDYKVDIEVCGGSGRQNLGFLYKKNKFELRKISVDLSVTLTGNCKGGLRPALVGDYFWKPGKTKVKFIGLHLKAGGDKDDKERRYRQFKILEKNINDYYSEGTENIVVMGDLNTTDYVLKETYYRKFKSFLKKSKLKDFAIDTECSSYFRKYKNDPDRYSSKLDHILVSKNLAEDHPYIESESQTHCNKNACEPAALPELGDSFEKVSDHCPVVSSLSL